MRTDRATAIWLRPLGWAVLLVVVALAAAGIYRWGTEDGDKPAGGGVVAIRAPAVPETPLPLATGAPARTGTVPTLPDQVIAHVRRAYPLLEDVAFACDADGCAITATIPPPTGEGFLKKRQEMLLGGLARLAGADGYRMLGPVQMDEVDDNLFHIRAPVEKVPDQPAR